MLRAVVHAEGKTFRREVEKYFIASEEPLFLGIILSPSDPMWVDMKNSSEVILEAGDMAYSCSIPYKIEVGSNTIFFARVQESISSFMDKIR